MSKLWPRTKSERYNFIAAAHVTILGLLFLGGLVIFTGLKATLGILFFISIVYLFSVGIMKWADKGD